MDAPNNTLGDADLDSLVSGLSTTEAAVLAFEVVSAEAINLVIEFVFASEEYSEYIGEFNDIMGIFIRPENGAQQNIALIPGTAEHVAVNTIHNGNDGSLYPPSPPSHPEFYVNNEPPILNIQYDGLTTLLTAESIILPNVRHHIKIAIADARDHRLDSAVFVKASVPCP